jgi:adenylate kinase
MPVTESSAAPNQIAAASVLLLVGPPGCGKGTQAERIAAHIGVPSISTGEMIRAEIRAGTELGKVAAAVTITGGLLSDELVNRIVESRLSQADCELGCLLDGYPRTVEQAHFLAALLDSKGWKQPTVIHIDVPSDLLVARTCNRRFCPQCKAIYNLASHPPKVAGKCDACAVDLQQRADDCEDTVRNRLVAYEKSTAPLIGHYSGGNYTRIDGTGSPDSVFAAIKTALGV